MRPNKAVKIGLKNSGQPRQPTSANFPTKKFVLVWQYSVSSRQKKLVPMNALYVPSTLEVLCIMEKLIEGK